MKYFRITIYLLLLLAGFTAAREADASVTRTGSVTVQSIGLNNTGSVEVTVPSDADYVVVGVTAWSPPDSGFYSGGSLTLNGGALSVIAAADTNISYDVSALFGIKATSTGTKNLVWDWVGSGSSLHHCWISVAYYKGVDQDNPIRDSGSEQGSGSANVSTGEMTGLSGDMAVAVVESESSSVTWSGATQVASSATYIYYGEGSPSGNVTITVSSISWGAIAGGVLRQADGGGETGAAEAMVFTAAAWVKPAASIADKAIMTKNHEIRLVAEASGYPLCQIYDGTGWRAAATSSQALNLNEWAYVACTYDRFNLRIYINGVEAGSRAESSDVYNTNNSWYFGQDEASVYGYFQGFMDEVKSVFRMASRPRSGRSRING